MTITSQMMKANCMKTTEMLAPLINKIWESETQYRKKNVSKSIYVKVSAGVRQGCLLSTLLFLIVLDQVMTSVKVPAGVQQGCLLSPLLFLIVLDQVMTSVTIQPRGIRWGLSSKLQDIHYADDICLMSHTLTDMMDKTAKLQQEAEEIGLHINTKKTEDMRIGATTSRDIQVNGVTVKTCEQFCYLGSIIELDGVADLDIARRINKTKGAFVQLNNV